ncbi:putative cutinase transcription factor 1 alpha [[Candida] jaroonii]|uniref:Cutinase transcription factor 1 alpha n=1 Tax=[Candida] jaroonii TaxID=467808 RepID=A0ACA9Y4Y7_9ASCO|nr:putative cutinase transcription factor 1 alpha [[Candida] jaroonii]
MSGTGKEKDSAKPKAFTIKYKRPRGSRACVVCRSRKVRCDAEIHIPCTNCITFGCDCVLPAAKKRGNGSVEAKRKKNEESHIKLEDDDFTKEVSPDKPQVSSSEPVLNISRVSIPPSLTSKYKNRPSVHKKELLLSKAKASFTFLGATSVGLVAQNVGDNHVQLNEDVFDVNENSLDSVELEILKIRGAFLLPDKDLALDLINTYFEKAAPLLPCVNRTEFMAKFNDPNDNPPLMLLQAVLLCGCRVSNNPLLLDSNNSNNLACLTFFRRAKALYETNYESDPITIVQTLLLIGTYWEGPEDVTKNSFYWTRVAIGLAQGFGIHRDVSNSPLSNNEKKIWRRVWWCLFEKDRNVAIAFGRPTVIDLNDCDVPMLTLEDFDENDDETGIVSPYPFNEKAALYFIHLVKLAEITGIIVRHQYTVKAESMKRKNKFSIIQHCDMLMGIWFTNLPPQLTFSVTDESKQDFYNCLLNAQYYNRLYLIHRSNLIRMARSSSSNPNNYKYPSWGISFQAARMISIIAKILLEKQLIGVCPVVFVYIIYSALLMLIYHVDSTNKLISSTASDSLVILTNVLKELSKNFSIASVLHKLFEKYASDKFKRAEVIERSTRLAMNQELSSARRAAVTEKNLKAYYGKSQFNGDGADGTPPSDLISPTHSIASGISPRGDNYINHPDPTKTPFEKMVHEMKKPLQPNSVESNTSALEEFSHQKKSDTSPNSSHDSFPDISLVTENMPTNQNFFENFEPTQLFPDIKLSLPPTRTQSPSHVNDVINNNMGGDLNLDTNLPQTPGGTFTNFIDNTFINMNLHSGADNFGSDDIGSFFNFQQ